MDLVNHTTFKFGHVCWNSLLFRFAVCCPLLLRQEYYLSNSNCLFIISSSEEVHLTKFQNFDKFLSSSLKYENRKLREKV